MAIRFLTIDDIRKQFPSLRPSRLDYLVREGLIECERHGRGQPRFYPPEAVNQIRVYLDRHKPNTAKRGEVVHEPA